MKQTHKVVMIATNEQSKVILDQNNKLLFFNTTQRLAHKDEGRNLYILSNDEIKEEDWFYDLQLNMVRKYLGSEDNIETNSKYCKKVIASTDKSLKQDIEYINEGKIGEASLPSIPESFIKKYLELYNSGKPIVEVQLEMKHINLPIEPDHDGFIEVMDFGKVHKDNFVAPKTREDNSIIIHQAKTYTREEVTNLIKKALFDKSDLVTNYPDGTTRNIIENDTFGFNKWIEENL